MSPVRFSSKVECSAALCPVRCDAVPGTCTFCSKMPGCRYLRTPPTSGIRLSPLPQAWISIDFPTALSSPYNPSSPALSHSPHPSLLSPSQPCRGSHFDFVFSHSFSSFLSPLFPFRFQLQFRDSALDSRYPPLSCLDRAAHNNFCWQPVISLSLLIRRLLPFHNVDDTSISSIRRSPSTLARNFHRQPSPISSFASHLRQALLFTTTASIR